MGILSDITIKGNYLEAGPWEKYTRVPKPASACDTANLFGEYHELSDAWEDGIGDEEAIEKRMKEIWKELSKREGNTK
jgi:hypothetical protein